MTSTFPGSVKTFSTLVDLVDSALAAHQNQRGEEITAIETWLTTNALTDGMLLNGRLSVTVSSNNLTVAIKTLAGTDPSATDPAYVMIGGVVRKIASALSVTLAAGTQWFGLGATFATLEQNFFAYLSYRAASSTVVLGFSRIPYATLYSDFSGTSTNEKYGAFSTAPASTDVCVNIGRFAATLSATASYNWSVPTFTAANLIQRPIYEGDWCYWAPAPTGFSSVPTNTVYLYRFSGKSVLTMYREGANGTSNANTFTATAPFTCVTLTNFVINLVGGGIDNSAAIGAAGQIASASAVFTFFPNVNAAGSNTWTTSGGKRIVSLLLNYPAAL